MPALLITSSCCNNILGVAPCLPYSSPLLVVTISWESLHACPTSADKDALFILVVTMFWESLHACPTHHLCSQGCSIHPCCNNVLGVAPCLPYLCRQGCSIHPCCNNVLGVAPCLPYSSPLLVVTMSWESLHACLTHHLFLL